uniref:Uncharacterized protein n=1 Tax=Timema cristinae TaxID=61476 RepID=A0A7R9CEK2_TIMCR|nr:unnamed protein product [Timema cristinae]
MNPVLACAGLGMDWHCPEVLDIVVHHFIWDDQLVLHHLSLSHLIQHHLLVGMVFTAWTLTSHYRGQHYTVRSWGGCGTLCCSTWLRHASVVNRAATRRCGISNSSGWSSQKLGDGYQYHCRSQVLLNYSADWSVWNYPGRWGRKTEVTRPLPGRTHADACKITSWWGQPQLKVNKLGLSLRCWGKFRALHLEICDASIQVTKVRGLDAGARKTGCLATHHLLTVRARVQKTPGTPWSIFCPVAGTLVLLVGIELCPMNCLDMFPQRTWVCIPLGAARRLADIRIVLFKTTCGGVKALTSLEWVLFWCLARSDALLNALLQPGYSHMYGFSPVCEQMLKRFLPRQSNINMLNFQASPSPRFTHRALMGFFPGVPPHVHHQHVLSLEWLLVS